MNEINLCFLTDNGYVKQTCIAITSAIENKKTNSFYNIYIICNDVSEENIEIIKKLEKKGTSIQIIETENANEFIDLEIDDIPATYTAIYKFNIPKILFDKEKVIYLDGDIIVNDDLTELFNYDIGNNYVGAVIDTSGLAKSTYRLFIKNDIFYFNSGVMIMNLKKMREDKIPEKLIEYRINGYNEFMDQDALNYVLNGNICRLPFKYNTQLMISFVTNDFSKIKKYCKLDYDINCFDDMINRSTILHFSGKTKPWKHCNGYGHDCWIFYYYKSPYKNNMINRDLNLRRKKRNLKSNIESKFKNYRRYKFYKSLAKKYDKKN